MIKRVVAVPLWFISTWLMYGLVAYFVGMPDTGGAIVGCLVAALICIDPTGAIWQSSKPRIGLSTGDTPARGTTH